MATFPPSLPPLNAAPSPLGLPGSQPSDPSALLGLGGAPTQNQLPNPLQNGPQLPPTPPTPQGVGGGFNQFA